ncbi:MAG: S41 family peptidase [Tannerella sp.]|jgi:C-terminal processing protease CtpA/Prc|nr:S41 family peptidase [Tannerella sp.]
MKKYIYTFALLCALFLIQSCYKSDEYTTDPHSNFEALWKLIDENYCFFDYKHIDWNAVHDKYNVLLTDTMNKYELYSVLGKMLAELEDGHTNLITTFNTSRFWDWHENYPDNFNEVVHRKYLGTDYKMAGGMEYLILRDSIGYVYYESFSNPIGEANLDEMFLHFKNCKALIFDVRNNGGGSLAYSERIASRFITEKLLVGYIVHKTGAGHNDFSEPYPIELEPSKRIKWLRPVAILTNRSCYSATNDFINKMKLFSQVTIIGDRTGGGCGLPFHSELPNGWGVRFSSSPILDANKEYTEYGIDPDIKIDIKENDQLNNIDTIIEEALDYLREKTAGSTPSTTSAEYANE